MNKNMLLLSAMLLTASVAVVDVRATTTSVADKQQEEFLTSGPFDTKNLKLTFGLLAVAGLIVAAKHGHLSGLPSKMSDLRSKVGPLASAISSRLPSLNSIKSLNLGSKVSGLALSVGSYFSGYWSNVTNSPFFTR